MSFNRTSILFATADEAETDAIRRMLAEVPELEASLARTASYRSVLEALRAEKYDLYFVDTSLATQSSAKAHELVEILKASRLDSAPPMLFLRENDSGFATARLSQSSDYCGLLNDPYIDVVPKREFTRSTVTRSIRDARRHAREKLALQQKIAYEQLLNDILSTFVNTEPTDLSDGIAFALEALGAFVSADRCYVWLLSEDTRSFHKVYQWCSEFDDSPFECGASVALSEIPWLSHQIRAGRNVIVSSIDDLPSEAKRERETFLENKVEAILCVPLLKRGQVIGFIGAANTLGSRKWTASDVSLFRIIGRVFVNALERKRVSDALHASEMRFRGVTESMDQGVVLLNNAQEIEYANRTFSELTSYRIDEIVGQKASEILSPSLLEEIQQLGSQGAERTEFEFVRLDGQTRWLEIGKSPFLGGQEGGVVLTFRDNSKRKEMELELFHSQKMEAVGRLAGGVAHDFNNLLTAVLGYSGLLLSRMDDQDPHRRELLQIRKASEQAATLVEQLLTFSRKQITQARAVCLTNIVADTARMLKRLIGEDVVLSSHLCEDMPSIMADPGQLQQIILNLAINARDAMPDGGNLVIVTESVEIDQDEASRTVGLEPGAYSVLRMSDTGFGMDEYVKSHIFDPFFTTKELGKGTGLGLSTVYGIVQQSGGTILLDSKVGKGTCFSILFPCVALEPELIPAVTVVKEISSKGDETILLVEDDSSVRSMLKEVLDRGGYRVLEADDGKHALEISTRLEDEIDLLVTDVVMPHMGGTEVAEEILVQRPDIEILIMSGYLHNASIPESVARRDYVFIPKPFSPQEFSESVRGILDRRAERKKKLSSMVANVEDVSKRRSG